MLNKLFKRKHKEELKPMGVKPPVGKRGDSFNKVFHEKEELKNFSYVGR